MAIAVVVGAGVGGSGRSHIWGGFDGRSNSDSGRSYRCGGSVSLVGGRWRRCEGSVGVGGDWRRQWHRCKGGAGVGGSRRCRDVFSQSKGDGAGFNTRVRRPSKGVGKRLRVAG